VGKKTFAGVSAVVLALAMLSGPFAEAAEITRESYKEAVEPICKRNVEADEQVLKGVKQKVKAGKLKPAAKQFTKAAAALEKAVKQLKAVPQPTADEAKLDKWLKFVEEEVGLLRQTAQKLNAGNKNGALAMQIRLNHTATQANNTVLGFEFHYCRVEPSKLT
jgi:glutamate mutase epsilon subunit